MRDTRKPGFVALRAGLAVGADAQHHEAWIDLAQRLKADAPLFQRSGAKVLKHHIRLLDQLPEDRNAFGLAQIQRDRLLVAGFAQPDKAVATFGDRSELPERVTGFRLFDLDDFGAEVGQDRAAERRRNEGGNVENSEAGQGAGLHGMLLRRGRC